MKKRIIRTVFVVCIAATFTMFFGSYENREFGDLNLFVKHRPTLKFYFFAPIGESDGRVKNLPTILQKEEMAYREYVEEGHGYLRSVSISSIIKKPPRQSVGIN